MAAASHPAEATSRKAQSQVLSVEVLMRLEACRAYVGGRVTLKGYRYIAILTRRTFAALPHAVHARLGEIQRGLAFPDAER